jgi:FkbM family methyltransferase
MVTQDFNRLKACRHGRMVYNINDQFIGRSLDLYGEWCEGEIALLKQLIRPTDTIVDVGAYIGTHTLAFAKFASGGGGVVAFEPQRLIFQTLCGNAALNSLTNVRAFQYACGEEQDTILVPEIDPATSSNFGGLQLGQQQTGEQQRTGEQVAMIRLDDLELPACGLIKIDVEGMELDVLKGAKETIERCKPVIYAANDRPDRRDALIRHIASLGYRMYWHLVSLFNPDNFLKQSENVWPNIAARNMLCVAGEGKVEGLEPVMVPG